MLKAVQKTALTAGAMASLALGGSALAGAASSPSTSTSTNTTTQAGPGKPQRQPLSSEVAAKVKAAALDKVPGATVLRTEAGGPYSTAYHAHIKTADGTLKVVLVNSDFEATAVQADNGPRGRGGRGHPRGGPGAGETALTGTTKEKVEAAVLAKYDGATIVRTETNNGADAPYESHITTNDGKELEVLVSKDFEVVGANERPAHP
jgi:hypothetical protein